MDDITLAALYAAWLALSTMPLGFMLGSSCSPCCGSVGCEVADGKPRTDPATEGVWTPSGTWGTFPGVTWTYSSTPSTTDGGTWFFWGSASTSKAGGGASVAEQQDWGNICNWYSNKTTSPDSTSNLVTVLDKRATRLPPSDAIVFIYGTVSTDSSGPVSVKVAYFYTSSLLASGSTLETTGIAHNAAYGAAFVTLGINAGTVNGGALFTGSSNNQGTVNDGAEFVGAEAQNKATVNGGATFIGNTNNRGGTVNGSATFSETSFNAGTVNGSATFNDLAFNSAIGGAVTTLGIVNDGAVFNDNAGNSGTVNDGAVFNDAARNSSAGTVNGGATFNDAACSQRIVGNFFATPCTRKFVAHPTDLPTCSGTANNGCVNSADTCGCG